MICVARKVSRALPTTEKLEESPEKNAQNITPNTPTLTIASMIENAALPRTDSCELILDIFIKIAFALAVDTAESSNHAESKLPQTPILAQSDASGSGGFWP